MRCAKCQAENRQARRFCAQCGEPLDMECIKCGFSNKPGERFCGGCGANLEAAAGLAVEMYDSPRSYTPPHLAEEVLAARAAIEGERKHVTVLFADLKGSLELIEGRDPELVRAILDAAIQSMMAAVHRYEGIVNQVQGDGIMALFGEAQHAAEIEKPRSDCVAAAGS